MFHRHFLFKTGTGTTPFFGAAAPGYTMATGTVYSTPARPLPRNSLSRGAFKFKKSPKHCSWKCTALIAVGIAVVLSIILCYCIGKASITLWEPLSFPDFEILFDQLHKKNFHLLIFSKHKHGKIKRSEKKSSYNTSNTNKTAWKENVKFINHVILRIYSFQLSYRKVFDLELQVDYESLRLDLVLQSGGWGLI